MRNAVAASQITFTPKYGYQNDSYKKGLWGDIEDEWYVLRSGSLFKVMTESEQPCLMTKGNKVADNLSKTNFI